MNNTITTLLESLSHVEQAIQTGHLTESELDRLTRKYTNLTLRCREQWTVAPDKRKVPTIGGAKTIEEKGGRLELV